MSTTESLNTGTHGIAHARHKQRIPLAARAFCGRLSTCGMVIWWCTRRTAPPVVWAGRR